MLNTRQLGTLSINTKVNSREHINASTLRSGKKLNEPWVNKKTKDKKNAIDEEQRKEVQTPKENEMIMGRIHFPNNPPPYMPPIPYLQRL